MIIVMAIIWFVITLPLPWVFTGDIGQDQAFTILPIIGFISITFVVLGIASVSYTPRTLHTKAEVWLQLSAA